MNITDTPMASAGLTSYRYAGRYGWIMIGAKGHTGALKEAQRSTRDQVRIELLQVWQGDKYACVVQS